MIRPIPRPLTPAIVLLVLSAWFPAVAKGEATTRTYLSGEDAASPVAWEFLCTTGRGCGSWTTIPVPSLWDMEGFGRLEYGHDRPQRIREQGLYRHAFPTPPGSEGRRTFLVFGGVMTDTQATLNGESVGPAHRGGFFEFRYEVTEQLRHDGRDNVLEVTVSKESGDPTVNEAERRADYWIFGGIFRPVWLETVPSRFVEHVALDARADGTFCARIGVDHGGDRGADADDETDDEMDGQAVPSLALDILDADGEVIARDEIEIVSGAADSQTVEFSIDAGNVLAWTAETPHLYTARVRLLAEEEIVHEVSERFGFRTIEVRRGDGVYVNGTRVTFRGVNRHSFRPETGRALSMAQNREDAELLKELNANAVRMSHYPPDSAFLEAADELGLYVVNELPGWQAAYSEAAGAPLVREMVERDRNHPSVIFWANGNEGGWNPDLDDDFARWDLQDRPLLHTVPGFHRGDPVFRGINTKHYQNYEDLTGLLAGDDIVLPTEFLHGLYDGGHGAGLRDYWDAITASPVGAGGFLWVLADEGTRRTDENGVSSIDVAGNLAPDGLVGPHHEREGSFYAVREIFSPVRIEDDPSANFDGRLRVSNAYDFVNLRDVAFSWELRLFPGPHAATSEHEVVASGSATAPDVGPGETGTLDLGWSDPKEPGKDADALALTATDPAGRELWTWVWPLRTLRPSLPATATVDEPGGESADEATTLVSGEVKLSLDPRTRAIESVTRGDRTYPLSGGPRLVLGGVGDAAATGQIGAATWSAGADGWFRLEYEYEAAGDATFAGVTFDLPPERVTGSRWLGIGPYRVWRNRAGGGTLGVWDVDANDTVTGWRDWIYPEFRGFFAGVRWMTLELDGGGTIMLVPEEPDLYVERLTPSTAPPSLQMSTAVRFPEGDLSLLHVIPAIGTKFTPAERLGPQSRPVSLDGTYRGAVWLRFD